MNKNYKKYSPYPPVNIQCRQWPSNIIEKAPIWCSVDLRDGNQALVEPMDSIRKMRMFKQLIEMGFKEIDIDTKRPRYFLRVQVWVQENFFGYNFGFTVRKNSPSHRFRVLGAGSGAQRWLE